MSVVCAPALDEHVAVSRDRVHLSCLFRVIWLECVSSLGKILAREVEIRN